MENIENQLKSAINFLKKEFSALQTGRANAILVEDLEIEAYGAKQPLKHLANISIPDSQTILIDTWDKSLLSVVEKVIQKNPNFSFSIRNDGVAIRLNVPTLTEDRRKEIVRIVHSHSEKAKISIRNIRHDFHGKLKKQKEDGDISEDEFYKEEKKLQEKVDEANKNIDELSKKKEQEVLTI